MTVVEHVDNLINPYASPKPHAAQETPHSRRYRREFAFVSLCSYVLSFGLPVVTAPGGFCIGLTVFVASFLAIPVGWSANPAYWTALWFFFRDRPIGALALSAIALIVGLSQLDLSAGTFFQEGFLIGYYVWLFSMLALLVGCTIQLLLNLIE